MRSIRYISAYRYGNGYPVCGRLHLIRRLTAPPSPQGEGFGEFPQKDRGEGFGGACSESYISAYRYGNGYAAPRGLHLIRRLTAPPSPQGEGFGEFPQKDRGEGIFI